MNRRLTTEGFIEQSEQIYGDQYDYTLVDYRNAKTKVKIVCKDHGQFSIKPYYLLHQESQCPKCVRIKQKQVRVEAEGKKFAIISSITHNNKYDYSKVVYIDGKIKVNIICPEHGDFWQSPFLHQRGNGCRECGKEKAGPQKILKAVFVERSNLIHNNKYDYSSSITDGTMNSVDIKCNTHGIFTQTMGTHLSGSGCPECASENSFMTTEQFLKKSNLIHGNKYGYSNTIYTRASEKVEIHCPDHGSFWQIANDHANNDAGCPACGCIGPSKAEQEILDFVKSIYSGDVLSNTRSIITPKEIDIHVPDFKLAIEYNGLYWHCEKHKADRKYHWNKFNECEKQGITLLSIYEDEWQDKSHIIKSQIQNKLQMTPNKIFARKCTIQTISNKTANAFYESNHIQGKTNKHHSNLGLFCNDQLVACMTLGSHPRNNSLTLSRYCTLLNYNIIGGASRLWKHISNDIRDPIISWSDNRYGIGGIYKTLGFDFDGDLSVDYDYTKGSQRVPKQNMQKKRIGCPPETKEADFVLEQHGMYRIYNCGKKRWVFNKYLKENQNEYHKTTRS